METKKPFNSGRRCKLIIFLSSCSNGTFIFIFFSCRTREGILSILHCYGGFLSFGFVAVRASRCQGV